MTEVYLYDALRTPRGKARPDGGLAATSPQALVSQLAAALHQRSGAAPDHCQALLLGCVGQLGSQGGHLALVSKLHAGLPEACTALTLNNYCVSGLSAVIHGAAQIASGQARQLLAGGVEMMSQVGFMADRAAYYQDRSLPPRSRYLPVALAADRLAARRGITRAELDAAALDSQQRAAAAESDAALQRSRLGLPRADGTLFASDECIRAKTSAAGLAALPPAFGALAAEWADALGGDEPFAPLHTISHAPPMCDGAGLALLGTAGIADARPRARIVAMAKCGADASDSLTAGFAAMERVLQRAQLRLQDLDRIEFMESFAVTQALFLRDHAAGIAPGRINPAGGHLAKGHPLGASGAILLSTLLDNLDACQGRLGLLVCTGASGVGAAMIVERLA
jgi:acetyl-CoA C-acetyltransferase/acetyl-CoA acyltransferase